MPEPALAPEVAALLKHDPAGLVALMGGRAATQQRLDAFFAYDRLLADPAGTARTDVAVGTSRLAPMLVTTRAEGPRSFSTRGSRGSDADSASPPRCGSSSRRSCTCPRSSAGCAR